MSFWIFSSFRKSPVIAEDKFSDQALLTAAKRDLHNTKMELCTARRIIHALKGCQYYGGSNGMIGSCIDCSIENQDLFKECQAFGKSLFKDG